MLRNFTVRARPQIQSGRVVWSVAPLFQVLIGLSVLLILPAAEAGSVLNLGATYFTQKVRDAGQVQTDEATLGADVRLLYRSGDSGFSIGGTYAYEKIQGTGSDEDSAVAYGPTGGIVNNGWSLLFTYYISAEREARRPPVTTEYNEGRGWQLDAAYLFPAGAQVAVAPQLTYRTIEYNKQQIGMAARTDDKHEISGLRPYLSVFFFF